MRKNLLLVSILIYLMYIVPPTFGKSYSAQNFGKNRNSKFISFNKDSGKIEMALDLSLPFLSIPLDKNENGGILIPTLSINSKTLAVLSVLTILTTVVPWLLKQKQLAHSSDLEYSKEHRRTYRELDILFLEEPLNKILFQNSLVTSCFQRTVCKAVASATLSHNPSNFEKIINSVFSTTWSDKAANGTAIKEAVWKGRKVLEPDECTGAFRGCPLSQQTIIDLLKVIGIWQ